MSAWGSIGPGTRVLLLALGGAVLAGAAALVWQVSQPAGTDPVVDVAPAAPAPAETPATEAVPEPPAAVEPAAEAEAVLPSIDTWRVAPDGEALVAGLALPGARVAVVVDDLPVAEGRALASGEFVLQFTLPPNPAPSLLQLSMTAENGVPVLSPEVVALGPIAGPELAAVAPQPGPEPVGATPAPETTVQPEPAPMAESAGAAPAALLLTEEGAVVLQDAAGTEPAPAGQVMIDTVAYTPTGSVQVGGRGDAGAGLRLYLDNGEVGVASVAGDGRWLTTLGDIAPGIYTLRVDQIDAAGQVTARFETPFKRETLEALAAVSGATPASQTAASPAITAEVPTADEAPPASAEPAAESAVESVAESKTETVSDPVAEPVAPVRASAPPTVTITVQPGFTLWGIAQERMGDGMLFVQVFDANRDRIKDPDLIYPGQVFSIPASPAP